MTIPSKPWFIRSTFFLALVLAALGGKRHVERRLAKESRPGPSLTVEQAQLHGDSLKRFSLGFDAVIANLIWIRLLQQAQTTPVPKGRVSWEFSQLDAVSRLQPRFPQLYRLGAAYLSVFRRDALGAKAFLERWSLLQPANWLAPYNLAYHLYFEMGDYDAAAPVMLRAAANPNAPPWLGSLGLRLLSQTASEARALSLAVDLIPTVQHPEGRFRLKLRIRSLRYNLEKSIWEKALDEHLASKGAPTSLEDLRPIAARQAAQLVQRYPASSFPEDFAPVFKERFDFQYDPKSRKIVSNADHRALERIEIHRNRNFPKHEKRN